MKKLIFIALALTSNTVFAGPDREALKAVLDAKETQGLYFIDNITIKPASREYGNFVIVLAGRSDFAEGAYVKVETKQVGPGKFIITKLESSKSIGGQK